MNYEKINEIIEPIISGGATQPRIDAVIEQLLDALYAAKKYAATDEEVHALRQEIAGWKRTALAMRDEAIEAGREMEACDAHTHLKSIEILYFDAAMCGEFHNP